MLKKKPVPRTLFLQISLQKNHSWTTSTKYNHWVAEKRQQGDDRLSCGDEWVGGIAEGGFRWRDGGLRVVNVGEVVNRLGIQMDVSSWSLGTNGKG